MGVAAVGFAVLATPALGATGDLDKSFGGDGVVTIDWGSPATERGQDLALASDGRIVVLGQTGTAQPGAIDYDFAFARLRSNGDLDGTFGSGGLSRITRTGQESPRALALQPDGRIVAAGSNSTEGRAEVVRLLDGGTPDPSLGVNGVLTIEYGGSDYGQDVTTQPDNKVLIAGRGGMTNSATLTRLAAPNWLPDPQFNGGGTAFVELGATIETAEAVAVQLDGKVVIAGSTGTSVLVARFTPSGAPDPDFGTGGRVTLGSVFGTSAQDVAVQQDGKIVLATSGGSGTTVGRLGADGKPDTSFDDDGVAAVNFSATASADALALQADGKVVVAASALDSGFVARLQPSGLPDATFHGSGKVEIPEMAGLTGVAIQPDGGIVVTGGDSRYSELATVARLEGDSPGVGGSPGSGGPNGGPTAKVPRCAGRKATIVGTKRANKLKGTRRADVIVALGGNDKVDGGRGNDLICAGDGNDSLKGGPGNDRLYGQNGKDKEAGGDGNDRLDGGSGNDSLSGDAGKDNLAGGSGKDRLGGGGGRDNCNGGSGKDRASCERERGV